MRGCRAVGRGARPTPDVLTISATSPTLRQTLRLSIRKSCSDKQSQLRDAAYRSCVPQSPGPLRFASIEPDLRSLRRCNVANDDGNDGAHLEHRERHKSKHRARGPRNGIARVATMTAIVAHSSKRWACCEKPAGAFAGRAPRRVRSAAKRRTKRLKRGLVGVKDQQQHSERRQIEDRADQAEDDHEELNVLDVPALRLGDAVRIDVVARDRDRRYVGEKVVQQDLLGRQRQERKQRRRERHAHHVPEVCAGGDRDVLERVGEGAPPRPLRRCARHRDRASAGSCRRSRARHPRPVRPRCRRRLRAAPARPPSLQLHHTRRSDVIEG